MPPTGPKRTKEQRERAALFWATVWPRTEYAARSRSHQSRSRGQARPLAVVLAQRWALAGVLRQDSR